MVVVLVMGLQGCSNDRSGGGGGGIGSSSGGIEALTRSW